MEVNLEERETAGKRISVQTLMNGKWNEEYGLENIIQVMADRGFNFAGKIGETHLSTTAGNSWVQEQFLFIKVAE